MQMHGDPVFVGFGKLSRWRKPVFREKTREIEHPYRESRSLVIQYLPKLAVVIGRWKNPKYSEQEQHNQLLAALMGRELSIDELEKQQKQERYETD